MSEVEMRSATLGDVDARQRLIDMVSVPWDQEGEIAWRGQPWREVFRRGAFNGLEDHAGRVPVNRQHVAGMTVGKSVSHDPYSELGLVSRIKIARTPLGDETLQLAEEDMLSPSVGFVVRNPSDQRLNNRTRLREVVRAFLDHIALVESPAYQGAQVLSVREEPNGLAVVESPLLETPAIDDVMNDELLAWASARVPR